MFSLPDDPAVADRMRAAHHQATVVLSVRPDGTREAWGWRGRTLGRPVTGTDGPVWLRLVCMPAEEVGGKLWEGPEAAQKAMPDSVPRPHLLRVSDWTEGTYAYRAELSERIVHNPVTTDGPTLRAAPDLSAGWWGDLRSALAQVAAVQTDRVAVRQEYLDRAMPEYLAFTGTRINTTVPVWTASHGDLHWANLTAPRLALLDWEGWGTAPAGFDVAMLHAYSLLVPETAVRVRAEFPEALATAAGRFAELAVITMLLQTTTRGDNLDLEVPLRERAQELVRR
ncbi:hypothetical protein ABCR94_10120 [Streptomyces sp. 21So2-11]|uniref:hypothetical protein n=1 Tax=Streptomyces sp. 21So2-11 TaxID=3144408 RepID=UPI00321B06F0